MIESMAGLTILGAGMQALGSIQAGQAAHKAGAMNALLNEQDALYTITMGKESQRRLDQQYEAMQGEVTAGFGSAGIETSSGSPLLVMAHNAREMALTKLYTQYGTDVNVSKLKMGADMARMQGKAAANAAFTSAAGSLIGGFGKAAIGASNMADSGYTYKSDSWFS